MIKLAYVKKLSYIYMSHDGPMSALCSPLFPAKYLRCGANQHLGLGLASEGRTTNDFVGAY
jgi:hypothetical protein